MFSPAAARSVGDVFYSFDCPELNGEMELRISEWTFCHERMALVEEIGRSGIEVNFLPFDSPDFLFPTFHAVHLSSAVWE